MIATQNPTHQIGTFPLPESQLDRFLMRIQLGYPDHQAERALLMGEDRRQLLRQLDAEITPHQLIKLQQTASHIALSEALIDYVQALLRYTRQSGQFYNGLSPRAGLGLIQAARAWAMISGRDFVLPEDVQAVFPSIVQHRLQAREHLQSADWANDILQQVVIP